MSDFPALKTGAVVQYPAQKSLRFSTQVVRFLDGSEQRFAGYSPPLRRWTIQLNLLDEGEISRLSEFFRLQNGASGIFSFTDPWDGSVYSSCSFENSEMRVGLTGDERLSTTLVISENQR